MKRILLVFVVVLVLATACTSVPTPAPAPPTTIPASIPPTVTPLPPTATATSVPPTSIPTSAPPPATATQLPLSPTPLACSFRDDFKDATLNPVWSWIREDNTHWSLSANPGYLRIVTRSKESLFRPYSNQKNVLLQKIAPGNFEITAKVTFEPSLDFQKAGLVVYQDDDNFVMLAQMFNSQGGGTRGSPGVDYESAVGGKTTLGYQITGGWHAFSGSTAYLKIVKDGTRYNGYFGSDGETWRPSGEYALGGLADLRVGITATNDSSTAIPEIPADFDYFCVVKLP